MTAKAIGVVLGLALTWPSLAAAQDEAPPPAHDESAEAIDAERDEEARSLYEAGRIAFDEGRYAEALTRFEEAYERSGRAELLYNVGMAADRLRRDEEALRAFEQYLEQVPEAENRMAVENRVRALREVIAEQEAAGEADEPPQQEPDTGPARPDPLAPVEPADDEGGSVLSKWWFWTIIGVVVVGAVVTGVAIGASSGGTQSPMPGDFGVVVTALGGP